MIARGLAFPTVVPEGYPPLADEPLFDPARHLALEMPDTVVTLAELGYSDEEIAACPSSLGITSCFRVLSDEGVAALHEVARALTPHIRSVGRIPRMVRGGVYLSRFLRDLCLSPEVNDWVSRLMGTPTLPHSIPHQLGHLNYNPLELGRNVDKWHVDTLRFDYVLFVTDPNLLQGGEFEYFRGTKQEMDALHLAGQTPPPDRVVAPRLPGAGYAVLQQGNMVVHRAKGLRAPAERITMVNGYVPADLRYPDYNRFDQIALADPGHVAASEYARHVAWTAQERLRGQIDTAIFTDDREAIARELETVAQYLEKAGADIRAAGTARMEHYGDG